MFYAHFVLAKKGPLARIWLAAHWDKKLTKAHVFETNIEKSVDGILQPKVKMALRTSGHLLLGVVRIYSRKAKYLLADCNEAFVKIKMAFRPGVVDLPEDIREAAVSAITLPEVFHDFDTPMPELNDVDIQAQFTLNQSRAEEITIREEYGNIPLGTADDGFGEMEFDGPSDIMRANAYISEKVDCNHLMLSDNIGKDKDLSKNSSVDTSAMDLNAPIQDDGFGGNFGQDIAGGLFGSELFGDSPMVEAPAMDSSQPEKVTKDPEDSDDDGGNDLDRFEGIPSVDPPSSGPDESPTVSPRRDDTDKPAGSNEAAVHDENAENEQVAAAQDQTTLLHNEEESFALAPVDSSALKSGWPRTKRKRKLIVDEVKNISGEEMKAQLSDTTDIVTTLDLAPPSKRLMHWKETGGVEKLFALPGNNRLNPSSIGKFYQTNLAFKASHYEDLGMAGDDKESENLSLEQVRDDEETTVNPRPRGRPPKRRIPDIETSLPEKPAKRVNQSNKCFDELIEPENIDTAKEPQLEAETDVPPINTTNASLNDSREIHDDEAMAHDDVHMHDMDDFASPKAADDVMDSFHNDAPFSPEPQPTVQQVNKSASDVPNNISSIDNDQVFPQTQSPTRPDDDIEQDFPEEQAEDETYEQFEERVVNKRAGELFHSLKKKLMNSTLHFSDLTNNCSRKQVAQKFYTLLVLKKLQAVELKQEEAYSEVLVSRGDLFEKAVL